MATVTLNPYVKSPISYSSPIHSSSSCHLRCCRFKMSSVLPPLPDNRIILGVGSANVDFLAAVASYPQPDDKIRSTSSVVQGGGNAGNALTCAARLGLSPRLISKVADDSQGKGILEELETDGVDPSFVVVSEGGNSPFTYVIVDEQTKTRTCIHTPGYPPMIPDDLPESKLLAALDGAKLVYFDGRLHETALLVAQECRQLAKSEAKLRIKGIGTVCGRLLIVTAEKIPASELIDTTGAGDSFIGAVLYGGYWLQSIGSKDWSSTAHRFSLDFFFNLEIPSDGRSNFVVVGVKKTSGHQLGLFLVVFLSGFFWTDILI